jgi:hypothetical protein
VNDKLPSLRDQARAAIITIITVTGRQIPARVEAAAVLLLVDVWTARLTHGVEPADWQECRFLRPVRTRLCWSRRGAETTSQRGARRTSSGQSRMTQVRRPSSDAVATALDDRPDHPVEPGAGLGSPFEHAESGVCAGHVARPCESLVGCGAWCCGGCAR